MTTKLIDQDDWLKHTRSVGHSRSFALKALDAALFTSNNEMVSRCLTFAQGGGVVGKDAQGKKIRVAAAHQENLSLGWKAWDFVVRAATAQESRNSGDDFAAADLTSPAACPPVRGTPGRPGAGAVPPG